MGLNSAVRDLHGKSLKSHKVSAFTLSERAYPPCFKTPKHSHQRPLFCFVIQGGYTETYGSRTCACEPSTLLFHAADELHSEHFHDSGGRSFIVEIEPWWLQRIHEHSVIIDSSADFNGGILPLLGMKLYREFLEMGEVSSLVIEGLMLAIIGETSRSKAPASVSRPPRWLDQAKQLLHDRFIEPLTLAEIAQEVGVHPVHLAQVFHKYYHCTVGEYVRQLRIDLACKQLASSNIPLCQIALTLGFADQSHFTRIFKRYMGVTPSQYRELIAKP